MTEFGGSAGAGTVFRLAPDGTETVLHSFSFQGGNDGAYPSGTLIADKDGNLYGTTEQGGGGCQPNQCGAIFEVTPDGTETVLYAFKGGSDGCLPFGGLVADRRGRFYGTTEDCGNGSSSSCDSLGCGTVFRFSPDARETVVYSFQGGTDGHFPEAPLILDAAGNLYGTTFEGGIGCSPYGCGTIFSIAPDGTETVLYLFCTLTNCVDGDGPKGGVIADADGNLYGTTSGGGGGFGNVFELAPDGTETVLHSFDPGSDGLVPFGNLVADKRGNLYGSTGTGGGGRCGSHEGCGVVYKLAPDGTETILHSFQKKDGSGPTGSLILINGYLYGTAMGGGSGSNCGTNHKGIPHGCGTVFAVEK